MSCRRASFFRFIGITIFLTVIGIAVHHRLMRNRSVADVKPASDAAVALRSLTGTTHPCTQWVDDFPAYTASHPGRWLVGHCARPCLSPVEANQSAADDAARQIYALAAAENPSPLLFSQLEKDVARGGLLIDQMPEKFVRPYGTLYTQTMLLDASPARIDALLNQHRAELQMHESRTNVIRIGAAGLLLLSWIFYLLINFITRGWFALRLQFLAGTITALAVVVLLGIT